MTRATHSTLEIPLPTHRRPTTPGNMLRHQFMEPMGLTQRALADALGVSRTTVSLLLNSHCAITVTMALRLERVLGVAAQFWLNCQQLVDMWDALHDPETKREIARLQPLTRVRTYNNGPATAYGRDPAATRSSVEDL